MTITVKSLAFGAGQSIPKRHTGDGEDLSPALTWEGVPEGTAELAIVVDDPDAPVAEAWVHWMLYGIPVGYSGLPEGFHGNLMPAGHGGLLQGVNSWGTVGYRGPAPPRGHGKHRYFFKVLALDERLGLPPGLDKKRLLEAAQGHILSHGELMGTYSRP